METVDSHMVECPIIDERSSITIGGEQNPEAKTHDIASTVAGESIFVANAAAAAAAVAAARDTGGSHATASPGTTPLSEDMTRAAAAENLTAQIGIRGVEVDDSNDGDTTQSECGYDERHLDAAPMLDPNMGRPGDIALLRVSSHHGEALTSYQGSTSTNAAGALPYHCDTCNVSFATIKGLQVHGGSGKHKRKLRAVTRWTGGSRQSSKLKLRNMTQRAAAKAAKSVFAHSLRPSRQERELNASMNTRQSIWTQESAKRTKKRRLVASQRLVSTVNTLLTGNRPEKRGFNQRFQCNICERVFRHRGYFERHVIRCRLETYHPSRHRPDEADDGEESEEGEDEDGDEEREGEDEDENDNDDGDDDIRGKASACPIKGHARKKRRKIFRCEVCKRIFKNQGFYFDSHVKRCREDSERPCNANDDDSKDIHTVATSSVASSSNDSFVYPEREIRAATAAALEINEVATMSQDALVQRRTQRYRRTCINRSRNQNLEALIKLSLLKNQVVPEPPVHRIDSEKADDSISVGHGSTQTSQPVTAIASVRTRSSHSASTVTVRADNLSTLVATMTAAAVVVLGDDEVRRAEMSDQNLIDECCRMFQDACAAKTYEQNRSEDYVEMLLASDGIDRVSGTRGDNLSEGRESIGQALDAATDAALNLYRTGLLGDEEVLRKRVALFEYLCRRQDRNENLIGLALLDPAMASLTSISSTPGHTEERTSHPSVLYNTQLNE